MRSTLNIDGAMLRKAAELTGEKEKTSLVRMGLEALIERERARRLARLGGSERGLAPVRRRRQGPTKKMVPGYDVPIQYSGLGLTMRLIVRETRTIDSIMANLTADKRLFSLAETNEVRSCRPHHEHRGHRNRPWNSASSPISGKSMVVVDGGN